MRAIIPFLLLTLGAFEPGPLFDQGGPRPRTPTTMGADSYTTDMQGTAYWARFFWHWAQQGPSPDSAITRVWNESAFTVPNTPVATAPLAVHRFGALRTRDSFTMTKAASGLTRTVWLCVNGKRGASVADTSPPACIKTSYTTPVSPLPPPVIDSARSDTTIAQIVFYPHPPAEMVELTSHSMCLLAVLPSGRVGYRGLRLPLCDAGAAVLGPPPTPTGQANIDGRCWAVTVTRNSGQDDGFLTWISHVPCGGTGALMAPRVLGNLCNKIADGLKFECLISRRWWVGA